MLSKDKVIYIMEELKKKYPNPQTELNYSNPFQLLIAVILSAQTTDKQVNKVTDIIFKTVKKPQDILNMWFESFENSIKSIGLYKWKAKNIFRLCEIMVDSNYISEISNDLTQKWKLVFEQYWYIIPDSIEEIVKLPWVWIKTAKVVLHVIYWEKLIPADTHVHRVANRLGLVTTKYPEDTSEKLEKIIPEKYKDVAHHVIILFGRYHCKAIKPMCEICPFTTICKYYNNISNKII